MCPIASVAHIEIDVIPNLGSWSEVPLPVSSPGSRLVLCDQESALSAVISDAEPEPELNSQVGAIARFWIFLWAGDGDWETCFDRNLRCLQGSQDHRVSTHARWRLENE